MNRFFRMPGIGRLFILSACLLAFQACLKKSEKQQPYYYSDEEVDSHKDDGEKQVDIGNIPKVREFLAGSSFVSKTYRISIDDSLNAVAMDNGKELFKGRCKIGEFMINDERILIIMDEAGVEHRFTLVSNGLLTDKSTYALYYKTIE